MPARLTVHLPSRPAQVLLLPEGRELVAGRDPGCDVALADDRVSRRHAVLLSAPAEWSVKDLGSKNGTLIDGIPVDAGAVGALRERSWISFGGLIARFEIVAGTVESVEEEQRRRFSTSLEVVRRLAPEGAPGAGLADLLPRVVSSMLELAGAERGFLLLAGADGALEVAARSGLSWEDLQTDELRGSLGAVRRVLATGSPVVTSDALSDADLGGRASVVAAGVRALVCVPVHAPDRLIGVMYADSRRLGAAFTELDLQILEALAAQAGLGIAVARLDTELKGLAQSITEPRGTLGAGA